MIGLLKRVMGEHIQLILREGAPLWSVEADPGQIQQVIMNLAVNSRDSMPQGGTLTLETDNVELNEADVVGDEKRLSGPHVLLRVSDTGHGMSEEVLRRAFEPFFTTKEQGKGTGLGLSTAYGIVRQSGGGLAVSSTPGAGSVFSIYLPRAKRPADWAPSDKERSADLAGVGTETFLVVEDEATVLALVTRVLKAWGYRILGAQVPGEALRLAEQHGESIDLILTDVVLPEMSGPDLVQTLSERLDLDPPVIYMSGHPRNTIVQDGRLKEGIAFLEKPFTANALRQKVRETLDQEETPQHR